MCEILAENLVRTAYLLRSADHTSRMPLDITGATSVARLEMRDPDSPCRLTGLSEDLARPGSNRKRNTS